MRASLSAKNLLLAAAILLVDRVHKGRVSAGFVWEPYITYPSETNSNDFTVLWKADRGDACEICWDTSPGGSAGCSSSIRDECRSVNSSFLGPLGSESSNSAGDHYMYTISNLLNHDTTYRFSVKCGSTCRGDGSFTTPPQLNDPTRILVYGDSRSGPSEHDEIAETMFRVSAEYANLALHLGDFVRDGECMSSWDNDPMSAAYSNIRKLMQNVPLQVCRGNHENNGGCLSYPGDAFSDYDSLMDEVFPAYPYKALYSDGKPHGEARLYYSFNYGNIHVSVLDLYDYEGDEDTSSIKMNSDQYDWLSADLDSAGNRWKIVTIHRPIYSANPNRADLDDDLQSLFEQKDVRMLLAGHDHFYARAEIQKNGKTYYHITTGGGGSPLYSPEAPGGIFKKTISTYHYTQIDARSNYLCFEAIDRQGDVIDYFEIESGNRPANYYHCGGCQHDSDCSLYEECDGGRCVSAGGWVTIDNESFESGWGIWNDGGADARRGDYGGHARTGSWFIRIQDGTSESHIVSDTLVIDVFDQIMVDFWYHTEEVETGESFLLEINDGSGSGWIERARWIQGTDFSNNSWYNPQVIFAAPNNGRISLRFRCDASGASDDVYIDDIVILGRSTAVAPTFRPTEHPSSAPSTPIPSHFPSTIPSDTPSISPTQLPSTVPSISPTQLPSATPSSNPSLLPSSFPSQPPTPLESGEPSNIPSIKPSSNPSLLPSSSPSQPPTPLESGEPSLLPSSSPSQPPTPLESAEPSNQPSTSPSKAPSPAPVFQDPIVGVDQEGHSLGLDYNGQSSNICGTPSSSSGSCTSCPCDIFSTGTLWGAIWNDNFLQDLDFTNADRERPTDHPDFDRIIKKREYEIKINGDRVAKSDLLYDFATDSWQFSHDIAELLADFNVDANTEVEVKMKLEREDKRFKTETDPSRIPLSVSSAPPPPPEPSPLPSAAPSTSPTLSFVPSATPSSNPSLLPSSFPSQPPTPLESGEPSNIPSIKPSSNPSLLPSSSPSQPPTPLESGEPSLLPSSSPSQPPTPLESAEPSNQPSTSPSKAPSPAPVFQDPIVGVDQEGHSLGLDYNGQSSNICGTPSSSSGSCTSCPCDIFSTGTLWGAIWNDNFLQDLDFTNADRERPTDHPDFDRIIKKREYEIKINGDRVAKSDLLYDFATDSWQFSHDIAELLADFNVDANTEVEVKMKLEREDKRFKTETDPSRIPLRVRATSSNIFSHTTLRRREQEDLNEKEMHAFLRTRV